MFDIRPHHGLCFRFFRGMGYSDAFSQNMGRVQRFLQEKPDTEICLVKHSDVLCVHCPHNRNGGCEDGGKASRYDEAVLRICGLTAGRRLSWGELSQRIGENILFPGRLKEVCGSCEWEPICSEMAKALEKQ